MTVAQVVPLRRFDSRHKWFDYAVPDGLAVRTGDLVTVPFRRRNIPGIVLAVVHHTRFANIKSIKDKVLEFSVVTDWQLELFQNIARWYGVSLGHLFMAAVPTIPVKKRPTDGADARQIPPRHDQASDYFWYRRRSDAVDFIRRWIAASPGQKLILCPTIISAEKIHSASGTDKAVLVTSRLTAAEYRGVYFGVLDGSIETIIGTARAIYLPFRRGFRCLIDQEEHLAYVVDKQNPRLDVRTVMLKSAPGVTMTSPAPTLEIYHQRRLSPPPAVSQRVIGILNTPLRISGVSLELERQLDRAAPGRPLLAIIPRRVFGKMYHCQDCGYTVICDRCQQPLRHLAGSMALCVNCQNRQRLPNICPQCRNRAWSAVGWNVDDLSANIRRHWPRLRISHSWPPLDRAELIFADYQVYQRLQEAGRYAGVAILNGDHLRARPDFAADETAWQYLNRLQDALPPDTPILVQTYAPDDEFWQRWKNSDDASWYRGEIEIRRRLKTPPFYQQLLATISGSDRERLAEQSAAAIRRQHPDLSCQIITGDKQRRLLITSSPAGQPLQAMDLADYFPSPWTIDPFVRRWPGRS